MRSDLHAETRRQILRCLSDAASLVAFSSPDLTMSHDQKARAFRQQVTDYGDLMDRWLRELSVWSAPSPDTSPEEGNG